MIQIDGTLVAGQSKNGVAVSSPSTGIIWVTVAGVSSATQQAVATADDAGDSTGAVTMAHIEVNSGSNDCSPGQFEFKTFKVTAGSGALNLTPFDQGPSRARRVVGSRRGA